MADSVGAGGLAAVRLLNPKSVTVLGADFTPAAPPPAKEEGDEGMSDDHKKGGHDHGHGSSVSPKMIGWLVGGGLAIVALMALTAFVNAISGQNRQQVVQQPPVFNGLISGPQAPYFQAPQQPPPGTMITRHRMPCAQGWQTAPDGTCYRIVQ